MDQINNFFGLRPFLPNLQSASEFIPDCDWHAVQFKFCTFSIFNVLSQLQTLDVRKATGPDSISALFLRSVAVELAEMVTFIFNISIQIGSMAT